MFLVPLVCFSARQCPNVSSDQSNQRRRGFTVQLPSTFFSNLHFTAVQWARWQLAFSGLDRRQVNGEQDTINTQLQSPDPHTHRQNIHLLQHTARWKHLSDQSDTHTTSAESLSKSARQFITHKTREINISYEQYNNGTYCKILKKVIFWKNKMLNSYETYIMSATKTVKFNNHLF